MPKTPRKTTRRKNNSRDSFGSRSRGDMLMDGDSMCDVAIADDDFDTLANGSNTVAEDDDTEEEEVVEIGDAPIAIDDPVRMYLMQMGEIPLLSRQEEINAARKIEGTRTRFRNNMLATDYLLHAAVAALEKVRDGQLRLDRTIEVSVTNTVEKKKIMKRIPPNVETLRLMLVENYRDFSVAVNKQNSSEVRRDAWRRLVCRRNRAVRLVEELNLRIQRLMPLWHKLKEILRRMETLQGIVRSGGCEAYGGMSLEAARAELHH
ncbi:MAG: hypothetical protein KDB23_32045, partial [Planctomycetales bacterium]|nr:hypothetical protein [Planctomycetales bacterium]